MNCPDIAISKYFYHAIGTTGDVFKITFPKIAFNR